MTVNTPWSTRAAGHVACVAVMTEADEACNCCFKLCVAQLCVAELCPAELVATVSTYLWHKVSNVIRLSLSLRVRRRPPTAVACDNHLLQGVPPHCSDLEAAALLSNVLAGLSVLHAHTSVWYR